MSASDVLLCEVTPGNWRLRSLACDAKAVGATGVPASPVALGSHEANPVFIDGIKCRRWYDVGVYVTMRDDFDCGYVTEFVNRHRLHPCNVDKITADDLAGLTRLLPQLRRSRAVMAVGDSNDELLGAVSRFCEIVMEKGGGFTDWPAWHPEAACLCR